MDGDENMSLLSNDHSIVDQLIVYDNEHSHKINKYNNSYDSNVVLLSEDSSVVLSAAPIDNNNEAIINNLNKNIANITFFYKSWLEKLSVIFHKNAFQVCLRFDSSN